MSRWLQAKYTGKVLFDFLDKKITRDDPAKSADFFEALDSGHKRFMHINAKIKA